MKPAWHYTALHRASVGATQYSVPSFVRDSPVDVAPQVMRFHLKHWPPPRETRATISSSCQPPQLSDLFCRRTTRFQEARAFILCTKSNQRNLILNTCTTSSSSVVSLPRSKKWDEVRCVPPYYSMVSLRGWGYTSSSSTTPLLTTLRSRSIVHVLLRLHHQMFRG